MSTAHQYLIWLALIAYPVHVLEEAVLGWKQWAETHLGLNVNWQIFYVANAAVMFITIATAMIGWKLPSVGLAIPALMLINGIFFHILPTLIQRKFSPGTITALILFLPISAFIYYGAYQDQVLTVENALGSLLIGGVLMASPILFLKLSHWVIEAEKP